MRCVDTLTRTRRALCAPPTVLWFHTHAVANVNVGTHARIADAPTRSFATTSHSQTRIVMRAHQFTLPQVLYNFEHVPSDANDIRSNGFADESSVGGGGGDGRGGDDGGAGGGGGDHDADPFFNRKGSFINADVLEIYRRYNLWDFSQSNVVSLSKLGIPDEHVPLGFVPDMADLLPSAQVCLLCVCMRAHTRVFVYVCIYLGICICCVQQACY